MTSVLPLNDVGAFLVEQMCKALLS